MLNTSYSDAIYGMLYFYGIIPLSDIFTISYKCGLCDPSDYKFCLDIITFNLINSKKAYFSGNKLCHRLLKNKNIVEDMQEYLQMPSYKMFTADDYIKAGAQELMFIEEMTELSLEFRKMCTHSCISVKNEVIRIWIELNNMCDLVTLTQECIDNLDLPVAGKDHYFLNVLVSINKLANTIPRWFCKGYSVKETTHYNKYN